jgi:hypothetical protein
MSSSNAVFVARDGLAVANGMPFNLPVGTTANRPAPAQIGSLRYNTDTASFEGFYSNNGWGQPSVAIIPSNAGFTSISVGNSTVNTFINSTSVSVDANVVLSGTQLSIGNSTINAVHSATGLTVGNASINSTGIGIGNSTVSVVANSTTVVLGNTVLSGSNLTIGNTTVNAVVNSTTFSGIALTANNALFLGGFAANQYAFANATPPPTSPGGSNTYIQVNNSGTFGGFPGLTWNFNSNTMGVANAISVGNATVSSFINSTAFTGTANNANFLGGLASGSFWTTSSLTRVSQLVNDIGYINGLNPNANYNVNIMVAGTYLYSSGNVYAVGDVYAAWSDARLKDFWDRVGGALDMLSGLEGWYYTRNDFAPEIGDVTDKKRRVGLIAQQVKEVLPEAVAYIKDRDGNDTDYMTIQYERLVPLLVEAVNELRREVAELKAR